MVCRNSLLRCGRRLPQNTIDFSRCQRLVGLVCCGFLLFVGCDKGITLVPASGVLTIDGQPAENITLQFLPDSLDGGTSGPTSFGETDKEGRFSLQTHDGKPGVVPGKHVVMMVDQDEERPQQGEPVGKPSRVPTQYSMVSSPLRVEVVEGQDIVLQINTR